MAVEAALTALVVAGDSPGPGSGTTPDGAKGLGGQPIAGDVNADPGDADGRLAYRQRVLPVRPAAGDVSGVARSSQPSPRASR